MTEEIIDVNKCGYYKEGDYLVCPVTCEEYIDCDFKTIFSLKQENEALKEKYNDVLSLAKRNADSNEYCLQELEQHSYLLADKLALQQRENEKLKENLDDLTKDLKVQNDIIGKFVKAVKEIQRVINLAHRVEDYLLGQDYTDLVDRIDRTLEEVRCLV